jgi:predicted nucleic-acid-binding protein
MKAIDTNILVQYLTHDDPGQWRRATRLIEECEARGEILFISFAVFLETVWVLGASFKSDRSEIYEVMEKLTQARVFLLESRDLILAAIAIGPREDLDPADTLIALSARQAGCECTLTFDRSASRSHLFEIMERY